MKKKAIIFDLMDTLIPDPFYSAVKTLSGSLRRFILIKNRDVYFEFEMGNITEEEYLQNCFKKTATEKAGFTVLDFKRELLKTPALFANSEKLMNKYYGKHDLFIASNYSIWIHHHLKNLNIETYFKDVIVSYQLRARKPSTQFFTQMIKRTNYRPEDIIFIDDRKENVAAAESLGMAAVLVTDGWSDIVENLL